MPSTEEETQINQAFSVVEQFSKIFVKNYPLVIKNGFYSVKMQSDVDDKFPYEIVFEVRAKK
jgi:hypothetical protein